MRSIKIIATCFLFVLAIDSHFAQIPVLETGGQKMPAEWIDKDTGRRLVRLSEREGSNQSFYFHNNPFIKSKDGKNDWMIFYGTVGDRRQIFCVDLQTKAIRQLTHQSSRMSGEIVGRRRREVFYQIRDSVFATHIDQATTRLVYVFPSDFKGSITTLNADETLLAGSWAAPEKDEIYKKFPAKADYFERIFEAKIPHTLFTINLDSGQLEKIHSENTWLGHIQFSTTDPKLLMFCHEGPWHEVDRIWNIDLNTNAVKKIHTRTVHREIAGHEFWSWDGKTIYYDLQIPRGETFYLAAYTLKSGKMRKYAMDRNEWSIHFNISHDQKWFAGDGGDPTQVAEAPDGQWIYLFKAKNKRLQSTKLVNMRHHRYRGMEPDVHWSPDGRWVIFRANFEGENQVYAVEVKPWK